MSEVPLYARCTLPGGGARLIRKGTTRAEDAQGTPTQSHISPRILVYEENTTARMEVRGETRRDVRALVYSSPECLRPVVYSLT